MYMLYPKMTIRNSRYRGPVESQKIIKSNLEITNSLNEITNSINNLNEKLDYLFKSCNKDKYINYNSINKIEQSIKR